MVERTVRIGSTHGLHARPAKLFAQAATAPASRSRSQVGRCPVNAASILGVIALGIEHGDYVTLAVDGDGAAPTRQQCSTRSSSCSPPTTTSRRRHPSPFATQREVA